MKKLFFIFFIALSVCDEIEESFDDNVLLEKNKGKAITLPIKPKERHITRDKIGITTRLISKLKVSTIPRKAGKNLKNLPIKRTNDIFEGKSGEEFRKYKNVFTPRFSNRVETHNKFQTTIVGIQTKNDCEKMFPKEVC